ncbi:MAG: S-adenosylmethionine:tRNA ribosyltransferase-isomerase [Marinifilaceae bacterium]
MECVVEQLKQIKIEEYTYNLPDNRIAKYPLARREDSKLLTYTDGNITEQPFCNVESLLPAGTTLIFNNTKVIHARIHFRKVTGAAIEVFCLEPHFPADYAQNFAATGTCEWSCMVGNLKKWKDEAIFCDFDHAGVTHRLQADKVSQAAGEVIVRFSWNAPLSFSEVLECCGRMPIPPYLNREADESDDIRYQTIFSKEEGSVAAPTAALHFSKEVISALTAGGVRVDEVTLHVGAGTFRPVKSEDIGGHDMHTEHVVISKELIQTLANKNGEIIAVGTTSVRTLESLYWMGVKRLSGHTDFNTISQWEVYTLPQQYTLRQSMEALYSWFMETGNTQLKAATTIIIVPGYTFRVIDGMFTNFHQPQSTLLLLVAAAVGEDWKRIYDYAMSHEFRFLSYGDSSLLKIKRP